MSFHRHSRPIYGRLPPGCDCFTGGREVRWTRGDGLRLCGAASELRRNRICEARDFLMALGVSFKRGAASQCWRGRHGKASLFLGRQNPSRALARGRSTIVTRWGAIFKQIAELVTGRNASAPVFLLKLLRRHGTLLTAENLDHAQSRRFFDLLRCPVPSADSTEITWPP